jgi:hypothetical protein
MISDPSVRPSVFCVLKYVVAWIAPTGIFVDGCTRNFGKLSVIVKAWIGLIFRKICQDQKITFLGKGLS